jgi:glycosyltransferase involved in cell wall biosynthesis
MKIQLIEAFQGGHHSNYIEALLPTFRRFLQSGQLTEVVITITPRHFAALQQQGIVTVEQVNLRFSPTLPESNPNPNMRDRKQIFNMINAAVSNAQPDAVICTSADYDVMMNAVFKRQAHFGFNSGTRAVGVFHYGFPGGVALSWKERVKQWIYDTAWRHASWDRYLFVNPLVYESLLKKKDAFSRKLSLLPDPVPAKVDVDMMEARRRLNIPTDGTYLGFVGMMDNRKAIPEVLAGFVHSKAYESSRLLLAGFLLPEYASLLENQYSDLVKSQRIIVMNRFLSSEEVQLGYAAIDVNVLLQYRRMNLSANLLKAVAYEKPIIVDDCGYTGMMAKRFALGELCHVHDVDSVSAAMLRAIAQSASYQLSSQARRLLAFHSSDNYGNTIMAELLAGQNKENLLTWDFVNGIG